MCINKIKTGSDELGRFLSANSLIPLGYLQWDIESKQASLFDWLVSLLQTVNYLKLFLCRVVRIDKNYRLRSCTGVHSPRYFRMCEPHCLLHFLWCMAT